MMDGVLAAALGGALGGLIGGLLLVGWQKLRHQPPGAKPPMPLYIVVIALAVGGGQIGRLVSEPSVEQQLDKSNPAIAAMHRYYPDDYAKMIAVVKADSNGDQTAMLAKLLPYVSNIVTAHAKQMDDDHARATFSLLVDELKLLQTKNPADCVALANGKPSPDLPNLMPKALVDRDLANTASTLEQLAEHPAAAAPRLTADQGKTLATDALGTLSQSDRDIAQSLLAAGTTPSTPPEQLAVCNYQIALYSGVLAAPPGTMRALLAG